MKNLVKSIVIILVFSSICPRVVAQTFKSEIILGLNASQVDGDNFGGFNKVSFNAGFGIIRELNEKWFYRLQILYARKGSASSSRDFFFFRFRVNYLEVPVLFHYQFFEGRLSAGAGLSPGYLLGANLDNGSGFGETTDSYRRIDVPYQFVVRYQLSDKISTEIRWSRSLFSYRRTNVSLPGSIFSGVGVFNRSIYLHLNIELE